MNKLLLAQIGVISLGIICIFTCFFLTIAEYHVSLSTLYVYVKFNLTTQIKIGSNTAEDKLGDCSSDGQNSASTNECLSWKWNYAMGILVIISGCLTLAIIILREFILRELMSRFMKQVRLALYAISFLSVIFALTGLIWLISCQNIFVVELLPIGLMLVAGVLIMIGGLVLEDVIAKSKGEQLLMI